MEWLFNSQNLIALITLTTLEIILGIDNIVVISILSQKLPESQQATARRLGLGLALITRILLLLSLSWLASLTTPLFSLAAVKISTRDLILITGGLFLLWKATREIHHAMEIPEAELRPKIVGTMAGVITQIILLDIVFFPGFGHHRHRHGPEGGSDDRRHCHCHFRHAPGFRGHQRFYPSASLCENSGLKLFAAHRRHPHRRGLYPAYSERVYLFCHGIFRSRGDH